MNLTELKQNKEISMRKSSLEQLQFIPGLWVNGRDYWVQDQSEKVVYEEGLILKVKQEQLHSRIRISTVYVSNRSDIKKEIKVLAMHQCPHVTGEQLTFVSPSDNRIFHFVNNKVYMVNGLHKGKETREYTVMPQWNLYTDKIWSSLDLGNLKYQPMVKGLAASILTFPMSIKADETEKIQTWTIGGANKNEIISLEQALLKNTLAFPSEK